MVVVRTNISVEQGDHRLFDQIRYFFYLTNDRAAAAADVVFLANDRCHQENLIDQLQRVGATRMPVDPLLSNWAYMVMATLAWTRFSTPSCMALVRFLYFALEAS